MISHILDFLEMEVKEVKEVKGDEEELGKSATVRIWAIGR